VTSPDSAGAPGGAVGDLVAIALGLLPADHPLAVASSAAARRDLVEGLVRAPAQPDRGSPELTLLLAAVELAAGEPVVLDRLDAVVAVASATWTWPELIDPVTGEGAVGVGDHLATAADLLGLVRELFVRDGETGLELLSVFPPAWRGQNLDVRDAPTRFGALSYAVRWHGDRPALLWELDAHDGVDDLVLRAPGVDAGWLGSGHRGEALLEPAPPTPPNGRRTGESFR
jgi:hypothetical protein